MVPRAKPQLIYRRTDNIEPEYWSFGVMDEDRTGEYKPCSRAYRDMIILSVKVIGQKLIPGDACNSF